MDRWIILVLFASGCFPYRETYRPEIDGVVVDDKGAPVPNVKIVACSATHWNPKCRHHGNTVSSSEGRFHFSAIKEWDWCCLGEAPLPYTVFAACAGDRIASGRVDWQKKDPPRLVLGSEIKDEWAKTACR